MYSKKINPLSFFILEFFFNSFYNDYGESNEWYEKVL